MNIFGRNNSHEFALFDKEPEAGDVLYSAAEFFKHDDKSWVKVEAFERPRLGERDSSVRDAPHCL